MAVTQIRLLSDLTTRWSCVIIVSGLSRAALSLSIAAALEI
jgi:hypothetical protein